MTLYAIANMGAKIVVSVKGDWITVRHSKDVLRDVCWFPDSEEATKYLAMFDQRGVTIVTDKTVRKMMGIKKAPSYIFENYKTAAFVRLIDGNDNVENQDVDEPVTDERFSVSETHDSGKEPKMWELRSQGGGQKTEEVMAIYDTLKNIRGIRNVWLERQQKLQEQVHELEMQELDILHTIEFYKPEDTNRTAIYDNLHNVRKERRIMKDEISALSLALQSLRTLTMSDVDYAIRGIEMMNTRRYRCRAFSSENTPEWAKELYKKEHEKLA